MPVSSTEQDDIAERDARDDWNDEMWWREPEEQATSSRLLAVATESRLLATMTRRSAWIIALLVIVAIWFLVVRDDGSSNDSSAPSFPVPSASVDRTPSSRSDAGDQLAVPTPRPSGESEVEVTSEFEDPDGDLGDASAASEGSEESGGNEGRGGDPPPFPDMRGEDFDRMTRDVLDFVHWIQEHPDVELVDAILEPGSPAHGHFVNDVRTLATRLPRTHSKPTVHDVRTTASSPDVATVVAVTSYDDGEWLLESFGFVRHSDRTWRVADHVVASVSTS